MPPRTPVSAGSRHVGTQAHLRWTTFLAHTEKLPREKPSRSLYDTSRIGSVPKPGRAFATRAGQGFVRQRARTLRGMKVARQVCASRVPRRVSRAVIRPQPLDANILAPGTSLGRVLLSLSKGDPRRYQQYQYNSINSINSARSVPVATHITALGFGRFYVALSCDCGVPLGSFCPPHRPASARFRAPPTVPRYVRCLPCDRTGVWCPCVRQTRARAKIAWRGNFTRLKLSLKA